MSEVKRFNIRINQDDNLEREDHPNGDYVFYSDYEKMYSHLNNYVIGGYQIIENEMKAEIEKLRAKLERERLRLAACGVIALANTPESAKLARQMRPDYESASAKDVMDCADREMLSRQKVKKLKELLLLTDPSVSDAEVGSTQIKQHQEFLKCFPDERKALQEAEGME